MIIIIKKIRSLSPLFSFFSTPLRPGLLFLFFLFFFSLPTLDPAPGLTREHRRNTKTVMGKLETSPPHHPHPLPWHGHITILTVSPTHRRLGYAKLLTGALERTCEQSSAWFVDLYVRASNRAAIDMYRKMGYSVYRRVVGYYSDDLAGEGEEGGVEGGEGESGGGGGGGEDAFDMRKPLTRDREREHVRENGEEFRVSPEDVY
jgi:N-terminal acetyltransferase B complex catalytic subunit